MSDFLGAEPGFVYIVKVDRYYKIGKAKDLDARISLLQSGVPLPLELIRWWETDWSGKLEAYLHKKYQSVRMHGEWFQLTDSDVVDLIKLDIELLSLETLNITYQINRLRKDLDKKHPLMQWRHRYGITQPVAAKACKTSPATISAVELGRITPVRMTLERLRSYTGLPTDAFIRPMQFLKEEPDFMSRTREPQ